MKPLLNSIKTILTGRKEKIAIAESVTGGDVQSIFSLAEDALSFFEGGMTVYNIHQRSAIFMLTLWKPFRRTASPKKWLRKWRSQ